LHGCERESSLHPSRTRASVERFGRGGDLHPRKFRCDLGKGAAENERQAHRHLLDWRVTRSKGDSRKLCRAQGKEDGPCLCTAERRLVQGCAVGRPEDEIEET